MLFNQSSIYFILFIFILHIHESLSISCNAVDLWPVTEEGHVASIACINEKYGTRQRLCTNVDGLATWEAIDDTNCRIIK